MNKKTYTGKNPGVFANSKYAYFVRPGEKYQGTCQLVFSSASNILWDAFCQSTVRFNNLSEHGRGGRYQRYLLMVYHTNLKRRNIIPSELTFEMFEDMLHTLGISHITSSSNLGWRNAYVGTSPEMEKLAELGFMKLGETQVPDQHIYHVTEKGMKVCGVDDEIIEYWRWLK